MVIVLMGVSGCGKTTVGRLLAESLGWAFHDADEFHPPANIAKMSRKVPLTNDDRRHWLKAISRKIEQCLEGGMPAVITCSALSLWSRDRLGIGRRSGLQLVYLKGSFDLIHDRISARKDHFMPADLLRSQFQTLEEPADATVVDITPPPKQVVQSIRQVLHI